MRFDLPDFSILTEIVPVHMLLKGRVVILHFPTNTILELVQSANPLVKTISPRYDWERVDRHGEVEKLTFIVHRYVTDDLKSVFEQARDWYTSMMERLDLNHDEFDHFLLEWHSGPDDLPN